MMSPNNDVIKPNYYNSISCIFIYLLFLKNAKLLLNIFNNQYLMDYII